MQSPSTDVTGLKDGDRVTVVFTVQDRYLRSGTWVPSLPVSELGNRNADVLSVVKAPCVPKAGDKYVTDMGYEATLIFIDDQSVVFETQHSKMRFYVSRESFDSKKNRQWL